MTCLAARELCFAYGTHRVLEQVDLDLESGSISLLAGCNGAGKSTLLSLLSGIRRPSSGRVEIDGGPIERLSGLQRARSITLIPQETGNSFDFTGSEIVMMGRHPHIPRLGSPSAADRAEVERALAITDASQFADRSVRTLSGGELRRIHIARALATRAPVLLADEPTANLDLEHAVAILELLRGLAGEGHTVLLSSHDLNLIAPRCDQVALLHDGRVDCVGAPAEVLSGETVARVFGVRSSAATGFFPRQFDAL